MYQPESIEGQQQRRVIAREHIEGLEEVDFCDAELEQGMNKIRRAWGSVEEGEMRKKKKMKEKKKNMAFGGSLAFRVWKAVRSRLRLHLCSERWRFGTGRQLRTQKPTCCASPPQNSKPESSDRA